MKKRRLPAPWTAEKVEGGYRVKDDHGHWLAFVYAKEDHQVPKMPNYLTWDEARQVAKAIARLPELLQKTEAILSSQYSSAMMVSSSPWTAR